MKRRSISLRLADERFMKRRSISLRLARLGFLLMLVFAVPFAVIAVLFSEPLEPLRRAKAAQWIGEALDFEVSVNGPVTVGFDWDATLTVRNVVGIKSELPTDMKAISAESITMEVPLLPLLFGHAEPSAFMVEGFKLDIEIPPDSERPDGPAEPIDVSWVVYDYVRLPFAANIDLSKAALTYNNSETGFELSYRFDKLSSHRTFGGAVAVEGRGSINGEPWKLEGKVEPPGIDASVRNFELTATQAGLITKFGGSYTFGDPLDVVDATLLGEVPDLNRFLDVYDIKGVMDGTAKLSAKLTGPLKAPKVSDLDLKLNFKTGDSVELTGSVDNAQFGKGLDLTLTGSIAKRPQQNTLIAFYDLNITGFTGRIEGSIDDLELHDLHITTGSVKTQLRDIGPISAERLYKDKDDSLGLYGVQILACDPEKPCLKVTGTIKKIISFQGVDLKGNIDFLTADFLDLAAEEKAPLLGHIVGDIAVSDADGSLGIEQFDAKVVGSSLLQLGINLVFDDLEDANELAFKTHLDIPSFKAFAAALGTPVEELGRVKFDGLLEGGAAAGITATGTVLVGATSLTGTLTGAMAQGRPTLSGVISTPLLHLSDLTKVSAINSVYQANVDDKDVDVFDYSKVWETLLIDLQLKIANIAGSGNSASNIQGRVTYLAGLIGLDPVSITFLGGRASATGEIDTRPSMTTFGVKGRIDNMKIGALLREFGTSYPVSGALHASYDLTGAGNTMEQIPKSLTGSVSLSLNNGTIGTSLLDLTAISLPQWLLTSAGRSANVVCLVAPFAISRGRATTHGLVMETNQVQVVGVGYVDFRANAIDLRFRPQALRPQFIKVAQPFALRGSLSHPQLNLTGSPSTGAMAEVLAFPFNLLGTIILPSSDTPGRRPCHIIHTTQRAGGGGNTGGPLGLGILGRRPPAQTAPARRR